MLEIIQKNVLNKNMYADRVFDAMKLTTRRILPSYKHIRTCFSYVSLILLNFQFKVYMYHQIQLAIEIYFIKIDHLRLFSLSPAVLNTNAIDILLN